MKLSALLTSAAVLVGGVSSAMAADYDPPSAYDWTGGYIGLHAGYGWGSNDGVSFDATGGAFPAGERDARVAAGHPSSLGDSLDGFLGGVQAGYNWQSDSLVLGLEADISYTGFDEDARVDLPALGIFAPHTYTSEQSLDWFGTARLKAGFAADRALFYLTGGLAFGDTDFGFSTTNNGFVSGGKSDFKLGWTIGGGIEYAVSDSLSLKGEYLYYDLGKSKDTAAYDAPFGAFEETWSAEFRGSIVRGGINFHF